MAYPIRKFTEGYYLFYETSLDSTRITEIERSLQYMEDVLRYLVIKKES
jgi:small subunit ribosomal protein S6